MKESKKFKNVTDEKKFRSFLVKSKDNDVWVRIQTNKISFVGISNEPMFWKEKCSHIHLPGVKAPLEINLKERANLKCLTRTGLFLIFPYNGKHRIFPVDKNALSSIYKRAGDLSFVMTTKTKTKNRTFLSIEEKARRLTVDFRLYKDQEFCKILIQGGKIAVVLSDQYQATRSCDLIDGLEKTLEEQYPNFSFDFAKINKNYLIAEYLLNDMITENKIRTILNKNGTDIQDFHIGIRFINSDTGRSQIHTSVFFDIDGVRISISDNNHFQFWHKEENTTQKYKKELENQLTQFIQRSISDLVEINKKECKNIIESMKHVLSKHPFPEKESNETLLEMSFREESGSWLDLYIALNSIIQKTKKKLNPSKYANMIQFMTKYIQQTIHTQEDTTPMVDLYRQMQFNMETTPKSE